MKKVKENVKMQKETLGITLIALVVTIIVLLILAGVTIATLIGDNGILTQAENAKNATEIANEKEIIGLAVIAAKEKTNYERLDKDDLQEELDLLTGKNKTETYETLEKYQVYFKEGKRYYEVDKDGNVEDIQVTNGEKKLKVKCVNSKSDVLGEYEYNVLNDNYSMIPPVINGYIYLDDKIQGTITSDSEITVEYYLLLNDDKTLVFTGLDSGGNVTTDENSIVNYMIGDQSSNYGNGVLEKDIKSILEMPETYKGKNITKIARNAFSYTPIIKADISDTIEVIDDYAFYKSKIELISIGKKVTSWSGHRFLSCSNLKTVIYRSDTINDGTAGFGSCPNFTEIKIENNQDKYEVKDNVIYSKDLKTLLLCPTGKKDEFVIPNEVEVIGGSAFQHSYIKSIIVSDNVETIKDYAFAQTKIESIKIGKNVQAISDHSFMSTPSLKNVIIDSPSVASKIVSVRAYIRLAENRDTIYISNDITEIGSYITDNYVIETTDKEGYIKYVKKEV